MAPQPKYNAAFHDDWAWSMAVLGATDKEIAEAMHITRKTVWQWRQDHKSFDEAIGQGKAAADAKVVKSLYQRTQGEEYDEEERIVETDKDGNIKPVRVRTKTVKVLPDTMACMYWLNNRMRGQWSQRQETVLSSETGGDVHIYLPAPERDEDEE